MEEPTDTTNTAAAGYSPKDGDVAALYHIDNSTGDRDRMYSLAVWSGGEWRQFDSNPDCADIRIIEHEGDEILSIWPMTKDRAILLHTTKRRHSANDYRI